MDKQYKLEYNIRIGNKNKTVLIVIPFPKDYPNNAFYKEYSHSGIAYAKITVQNQSKSKTSNIHINQLYVNAARTVNATAEEKAKSKGLGIRLLRKILSVAVKNDIIDSNLQNYITLEASGGVCDNTYPFDKIVPTEQCYKFLKMYKDTYKYAKDKDFTIEELNNLVCDIKQNNKLVYYYYKLGFRVMNYDDGMSVKMCCLLSSFMKQLNKNKNNSNEINPFTNKKINKNGLTYQRLYV